jgi:hypothetical protein
MRRIFFTAFIFCFVLSYAKPNIPEALWNAKTAYVGNDGAEPKDVEKLSKLLGEWGQFQIVQDKTTADIVITLSTQLQTRTIRLPNTGGGFGGMNSQQVLVSTIRIFNAKDSSTLYTDETGGDSKDPKQLVDRLKHKMKKKDKEKDKEKD